MGMPDFGHHVSAIHPSFDARNHKETAKERREIIWVSTPSNGSGNEVNIIFITQRPTYKNIELF